MPDQSGGVQAKVCILCKKDCSKVPRLKDAAGHYACKACIAKKQAAEAAAAAAAAEPEELALEEIPAEPASPSAVSDVMCPSCGAYQGSVDQCVACGYSRSAGKKVKRAKEPKEKSGVGLGSVVSAASGLWTANPIVWVLGGLVGGGIGAAIWAVVAWKIHYEHGIIAWGVGVLAGAGVALVARGNTGMFTGIVAAVCALTSVGAGKYMAVSLAVDQIVAQLPVSAPLTDEDLQMHLGAEIADEWESAGKELKWPKGEPPEDVEGPGDLPPDLWAETTTRWKAATPEWQADYRSRTQTAVTAELETLKQTVKEDAFKGSFGLFDILWLFLALGSAFKIGSGGSDGGD
ncbi:MAG: hypothetical protein ACKVS8_14305 [Phycisphaerales bacterium]